MTQQRQLLGRLEMQVVRDPVTDERKIVFRNQKGELVDPQNDSELFASFVGAAGLSQSDLTAALSAQHTADNGVYGRLTEAYKGATIDVAGADPSYPGYPGVSPPGGAAVNDSRAAIQAALDNAVAKGNPSSNSHYKYLNNAPTKVILPPGNYYVGLANAQGTTPSLVVPPSVQFDYSRANLYFEVPKTSTYAWCGIQVGNYAHLKRGNTYVAPARANGTANTWPDGTAFYDACRVVFTDADTVIDDTSAIVSGFQGAAVGLFGAFITGIVGGQIRNCVFDVRASNVYATNPFGLTVPAESDAPNPPTYRMTTDVYVWGKRHSIKCAWGGYAGVFIGQTGSELQIDYTNYNQQVLCRDWIVEDTFGPAWLVASASVFSLQSCAAEETGGTPGVANAGFRPVIRVDNVNQVMIGGGFRYDLMGNVGTYPGPASTSGTANPNTLLHVTSTENLLLEGVRCHQTSQSRTRTLSAAANIGDFTISLTGAPVVAQQFVMDGGSGESIIIDSWTGTGPYTAVLRTPLTANHASGSTLLGSSVTLIEGSPTRSLNINIGAHAAPYDFPIYNGYHGAGIKAQSARYAYPVVLTGTSGARYLWVDSNGSLRHKPSPPTNDTDGSVVTSGTSMGCPLISGRYYVPAPGSLSTSQAGEGSEIAIEMVAGRTCTLTSLSVYVITAGSTGAVGRLGIRADNTATPGIPGALLLDAGTVIEETTGGKELSISLSVIEGQRYWLTYTTQGAATTRPIMQSGTGAQAIIAGNTNRDTALVGTSAVYASGNGTTSAALPATQSVWSPASGAIRIAVKAA